jgi:PAS domain S-box-containing protein
MSKNNYPPPENIYLKNLEQIINQSDSIAYVRENDSNWTVTYISKNISRLGYKSNEFYSTEVTFAKIIHQDDVARIKAEMLFAMQQRKNNARLEYRLISKSKEIFWISDVLEILYDTNDNVTHCQGIITDISHRKEIEEKISAQNKIIQVRNEALFKANDSLKKSWDEVRLTNIKLAESEEKFKVISDQAQLGIIIIQDGLIKYFNKAFIELISYTEKEVLEWKEFEFIKAVYSDDKPLVISTIEKLSKSNNQEEFNFEFRRFTKHKEIKWLSQWSKTIIYESKKAILVTLLDIDENKKWQDALTESETRLRAKLDFILSPDKPIGDLSITDIFEIDQLQKLQDSFAIAHDVASIITDTEGVPITQPSNFNPICNAIRSSNKGKELCQRSDKIIGQKARESLKPFSTNCLSCGFLDAGAPIIVGGKHIANWMMGQAFDNKITETQLHEFAVMVGADQQVIKDSFLQLKLADTGQFNKVVDFLWNMAKEISALGYNNLKLARDIEERKKMEIALRESEELYRQLVDTSPDGIALVDLNGKMQYVSPRAKQLFGYPIDYVTEGLCIFDFIEPSYRQLAIENVTSILEKSISFSGTYIMVRKDTSTFTAEVNSTSIKDYFGNTKGMISIIRDITERKKVEEELIKAKNKAEESDKLKSAFLANMSHEIRTPMNGILGFASLLNEEDTTPTLRKEYADIINQNGNILLKLIDDILDIAKIEAGQLKIYETQFYLDQVLYEQYMLFKTLIDRKENKNIKLKLVQPDYKITTQINCDQSRLSQVLTNLLSNAIKFTHSGTIEFGYILESPANIKFFVKDTGIGLTKEKSSIIFDRFRQADESSARRYGGTGLGLTISSNLVRLMGGKIWVESELNKGSNFFFTIPYNPCYDDIGKDNFSSLLSNKVQYNWQNKHILIAEDEPMNYMLLKELLKSTKINILYAQNGREAIDLCQTNDHINLVLMDIKMPEINGYQATKEIKKIRQNLPIIAQSAYAMEEEIIKCKVAGCDDYISKPIDHQKLLLILNNFLNH